MDDFDYWHIGLVTSTCWKWFCLTKVKDFDHKLDVRFRHATPLFHFRQAAKYKGFRLRPADFDICIQVLQQFKGKEY